MTGNTSPWLSLYESVPATISPQARTALEMFTLTLERNPDAPLVHYFDHSLSARELDQQSDAFAVELQQRGIEHGDRVAMYLQNIPQVFTVVLAAWKCGAVIVPCNPMLKERELVKILADSGSRVIVCQEDLYADVVQAALPSTAVQHTITTSPLEYVESQAELPGVLANMARMPSANTDDLIELIQARTGQQPERPEITGDDVAFVCRNGDALQDLDRPEALMDFLCDKRRLPIGLHA